MKFYPQKSPPENKYIRTKYRTVCTKCQAYYFSTYAQKTYIKFGGFAYCNNVLFIVQYRQATEDKHTK